MIETTLTGWFNYNFECDWLIELSDNKLSVNKLSDNNLASELVENKGFFNQSQLLSLQTLRFIFSWYYYNEVTSDCKNGSF